MKIVGMLHVFNEADIIREFLDHMKQQSIPLVVLDNGSTDGTYDIIKKNENGIVIDHAQLITERFELVLLLRCLHAMTFTQRPDWILHVDADEFLEDRQGSTLHDAIAREAADGHDLIQFDNYEFWPTSRDEEADSVRRRMRFYSWNDRFQFRAWKHAPEIRIHPSGGHMPIFPQDKQVHLSPTRFVMRHYSIRGFHHGRRKVFKERLGRYSEFDKALFKMKKYNNYRDVQSTFVIEPSMLTRYDEDGRWNDERKFTGWRSDTFPDLRTSVEVRKMMNDINKQYAQFCAE